MKELDDILKEETTEEEKETPTASKTEVTPEQTEADRVRQELENLNRAKEEAKKELQRLRAEKSEIKGEVEKLPVIDKEDPSNKAWLKEIRDNVNPFHAELEKEKEEIFNFSLEEILTAHPALASDTEKLKKVISTYERIKDNSGRTREGVIIDLKRAIAAENYQEVEEREREAQFDRAKDDLVFSAPAISRGSTTYKQDRDRMPNVSDEERRIIEAQGWSVDEWWKAKKKHDNQ
jgi:chromosome segregation ATPase